MRIINALSMIAAAVLVACGGDKITPPPSPTVDGAYALQSVNGQALPITFDVEGTVMQLTASSIDVHKDHTYSYSFTLKRLSDGQSVSDGFSGSYGQSGNTITFSSDGQVMMVMSWNGSNQLTESNGGVTLIYEK